MKPEDDDAMIAMWRAFGEATRPRPTKPGPPRRAPIEATIQTAIRLALGREPDLALWRNETGVAVHNGRRVRYGLCVGSADIIGILAPAGRFVALEVKTATGRVSPDQVRFLQLVRNRGGFAAVVRSVDDARAALERARMGENE